MWPFSSSPRLFTGRVLTAEQMRAALGVFSPVTLGKAAYAEVSSKAVIYLAQKTRDALFSTGIIRWQPDATCTLFAAKFSVLANELFISQAFHDPISSQVLAFAAGDEWFRPDDLPGGNNHAIGVCVTEIGLLHIDPQAPDRLRGLSATELLSRTQTRFL